MRIYEQRKKYGSVVETNITCDSQTWAYPTISKAFYDPLSHKIGMKCLVISSLMELHVSFSSSLSLSLSSLPLPFSGAIIINSSPQLPSASSSVRTLFNSWNDDSERDIAERHEGL